MRNLFRAAVALGALGLAVIGCNRSGTAGASGDEANQTLDEAPYRATFLVPGMT
jgi:hypothetical protein